jgi:hypothetical protein
MTAPVETKVAAAASSSTAAGVIWWVLVTFIPAWHHGLPPALATSLPFIAATITGAVSGYLAPHTPRPGTATSQPPA